MANTPKKPETGYYKYVLLSVVILVIGYFIVTSIFNKDNDIKTNKVKDPNDQTNEVKEPQFVKNGELEFIKKEGKSVIKKIDIEIADSEEKAMQGLMFRKSMLEDRGMLFIFTKPEEHSFWMKNTLMSLDIIFIDSNKRIVNMYKNTTIKSLKSLPSLGPIQYVVEVIAGFTDKYGIKEGDKISYKKI